MKTSAAGLSFKLLVYETHFFRRRHSCILRNTTVVERRMRQDGLILAAGRVRSKKKKKEKKNTKTTVVERRMRQDGLILQQAVCVRRKKKRKKKTQKIPPHPDHTTKSTAAWRPRPSRDGARRNTSHAFVHTRPLPYIPSLWTSASYSSRNQSERRMLHIHTLTYRQTN